MRVLGLTLAGAFLGAACGGAATPSPTPAPPPKPVIVAKIADSSFGKILVDSKEGKTLYIWFKDTDENSQCYDACAAAWPPLLVDTKNIGGDGVTDGKLSATARKDGKLPAAYKQQPLYPFVPATAPGGHKRQGMQRFRALWV